MRQSFATQFGELEDRRIPAKEYIEKHLHELETGEFRAEPRTEVLSRDEVDPDVLLPAWDAKGVLALKKGGSKTRVPTGPEQLRLRLTVLANALIMIRLKHPSRKELGDATHALFEKYKEYLLSDYCYGLRSSEESGSLLPPMNMLKGSTPTSSWPSRGSRYSAATRTRQSKRGTSPRPWPFMLQGRHLPITCRGAPARATAKARARRAKARPLPREPPTRPRGSLSASANSKVGCAQKKCRFAHVCQVCFAKHPSYQAKAAATGNKDAAATPAPQN